jgi:hypothetical protein
VNLLTDSLSPSLLTVIPSQSEKQLRRTSSFERRRWRGNTFRRWYIVPYADGVHSLRKLKEKLSIQRQHLDELDKHIKELEKDSGGEQH